MDAFLLGDVEEVVPALRWKDLPISRYAHRKPLKRSGTSDVWRHFSMYEKSRQRNHVVICDLCYLKATCASVLYVPTHSTDVRALQCNTLLSIFKIHVANFLFFTHFLLTPVGLSRGGSQQDCGSCCERNNQNC